MTYPLPAVGSQGAASWADAIASALNGLSAAWTSYVPVLTAQTTNPTLGASTLTGEYRQFGKTVNWSAVLTIGSGFSAGSGYYILTLPVAAAASFSSASNPLGQAVGFTGGRYFYVPFAAGASSVIFAAPASGALLSNSGVNGTAWASGHSLAVNGTYESV